MTVARLASSAPISSLEIHLRWCEENSAIDFCFIVLSTRRRKGECGEKKLMEAIWGKEMQRKPMPIPAPALLIPGQGGLRTRHPVLFSLQRQRHKQDRCVSLRGRRNKQKEARSARFKSLSTADA